MPKASTPSFIAEFPLRTSVADERALSIRLDAARQIYNAALGSALRVLDLMRQSTDWQRARLVKDKKTRGIAFRACVDRFDFKSSMTDRVGIACKNGCWIADHLTANETQKAALRAFQAVRQYSVGRRGRPRFKRVGAMASVEGKTNATGIRFHDGLVEWKGLRLALRCVPDQWQAHALAQRTKYCRILRRTIAGRDRWYVQLIQEGRPLVQHAIGSHVVGLDIGPSTIAAVSATDAILEDFCPSVVQPWKRLRVIERGMDRSRRATNPQNYQADGTIKRGTKRWHRSARYQARQRQRFDVERRLAAERKRAHGELANRILAQGATVKTERLSYRSFQKNFGRSTKVRSAGAFVAALGRKADAVGGQVVEFSTRSTRLSQFDHVGGTYTKKPLSQREHVCADGTMVQRDLYSAFLARFVDQDRLDARSATDAFPAAEPLLQRAASSERPSDEKGCGFPRPPVREGRRVARPLKRNSGLVEAKDVVAANVAGESLGEIGHSVLQNPPALAVGRFSAKCRHDVVLLRARRIRSHQRHAR